MVFSRDRAKWMDYDSMMNFPRFVGLLSKIYYTARILYKVAGSAGSTLLERNDVFILKFFSLFASQSFLSSGGAFDLRKQGPVASVADRHAQAESWMHDFE